MQILDVDSISLVYQFSPELFTKCNTVFTEKVTAAPELDEGKL